MKLFELSHSEEGGYDTYDSAIVAAKTEEDAKKIHPSDDDDRWSGGNYDWVDSPDKVTATLIGTAVRGTKRGVVLASFNAG